MSSKEEFRNEHMLRLQGKEYLPVAPRVVMFRAEKPEWTIMTTTASVGDDFYVKATIVNDKDKIMATAHKRVRKDGKGPAAQFPVETAETGAIGRALALCGYGTLSGDLDEHDELADAPVERELQPKVVGKKPTSNGKSSSNQKAPITKNATPTEWVARLDAVKTKAEFESAYGDALEYIETLARSSDEFAMVAQAGVRARNRVA
jgi:hypothetical protein